MEKHVYKMLLQAVKDGPVECPDCGSYMDPDQEACLCGFSDTLRANGLI